FDEKKNRSPLVAAFFIALAFALYSGWWFYAAKEARAAYMDFLGDLTSEARGFTEPDISGYPGPVTLSVKEEYLQSPEGTLWVRGLQISGWPFPFVPIGLKASSIQADSFKWPQPLHFQN